MKTRPSLDTFRFFEVAARRLSFTAAAEELYVTHGAVSQRIRSLEDYLGLLLFERRGRSMVLTASGKQLRIRVAAALSDIDRAVDDIRPKKMDHTLTVSALPIFAARWLIPRLAKFNEIHPDISVNIRSGYALADFDRGDVDLAIRFGAGGWPNLHAEKLFDEELFPVCSPKLSGLEKVRKPSDLMTARLLHDYRQPWSMWLESFGVRLKQTLPGPMYLDSNLLLDAALAGHGIALGRASLVQSEIDAGRLVRVLNESMRATVAHYIVHPVGAETKFSVAKFKAWMFDEAKHDLQNRAGNKGKTLKSKTRSRALPNIEPSNA